MKPEKSTFLGQKNSKEIIISHKETRIVKDVEDYHGLQMPNFKIRKL